MISYLKFSSFPCLARPMSDAPPHPLPQAGRFALFFPEPQMLSLQSLDGIGPKTMKRMRDRGLMDQADLLLWMPRKFRKVAHFLPGDEMFGRGMAHVEFYARITHVRPPAPRTKQPIEVTVEYEGHQIRLVWFNMGRSSFVNRFAQHIWLHIKGEVQYERSVPQMFHPDVEALGHGAPRMPEDQISLEPIYSSIEGIGDQTLRKAQHQALARLLPALGDIVPEHLLLRHGLPGIAQALHTIHVMEPQHDVEVFSHNVALAKKRLVYEEFYTLQRKLALDYKETLGNARTQALNKRELSRSLLANLPFSLTQDQSKACTELAAELARPHPMRRLLQGDVGSGKTIVSFLAAAIAIDSGVQVALMAPTEILARQHERRAREFFDGLGVQVGFLGGSLGARQKREALADAACGKTQLLIGTHSLFQDDLVFDHLGLVIVDEQHKFGVEQRELLLAKGQDPHLLAMTATPIPRSLAHAVFGDLDLTVIRQKPPGRQPVRTVLRDASRGPKAYEYILERIRENGEQAYFVYPLVEASEAVGERKNVVDEAKMFQQGVFASLRVGVLHGRLETTEKDRIMESFSRHELDVLCSTTVIEVGVDVPNATIMVIEHPELFGLSQLHQLRGRVGRGLAASMCILLAGESMGPDAQDRLLSFVATDDGFELAEADLRIRGPGLFLGLRQAGHAEFRFGDLSKDAELLELARRDAREEALSGL